MAAKRRGLVVARPVALLLCSCAALASAGSICEASSHSTPNALQIADLQAARWIREVALHPNGSVLAYVVCGGMNRDLDTSSVFTASGMHAIATEGCTIQLIDTRDGRPLPPSFGPGTHIAAAWSPDGMRLAFVSDRDGVARVWILERQNQTFRRITSEAIRIANTRASSLKWSPDGHSLLARVLPVGMSLQEANENVEHHRSAQGSAPLVYQSITSKETRQPPTSAIADGLLDSQRTAEEQGDLALIDIASGDVKRLTSAGHISWFDFSPDGETVAFQDTKGMLRSNATQVVQELAIVSVSDGHTIRRIRHTPPWFWSAVSSWSPTGGLLSFDQCRFLTREGEEVDLRNLPAGPPICGRVWDSNRDVLYVLNPDEDAHQRALVLWRIDPRSRAATRVVTIPGASGQLVVPKRGDRPWSPGRPSTIFALVMSEKTKRTSVYRIDADARSARLLHEFRASIIEPPESARQDASAENGGLFVFLRQDAQNPPDLWIVGSDFSRPRRLTRINPQLERYRFGAPRLIEWRGGHDGRLLRGALILPADYKVGTRYPLVVLVYGGSSLSRTIYEFGGDGGFGLMNVQLLSTRNYVVLMPDSYVRVGTPMRDIAAAVLPGIDKAIELGVANPDRIGVIGHSYGGYSVLSLLVQSARFKAAVASAGPYDLWGTYGTLEPGGNTEMAALVESRLGGSPWEFPMRYTENSPTRYLDQIATPLLLLHGGRDNVPVRNAEIVFVGLRRLEKTVEYALYPDERHRIMDPDNQQDYVDRYLRWLDRHLKE